jgi:hypothetical protein
MRPRRGRWRAGAPGNQSSQSQCELQRNEPTRVFSLEPKANNRYDLKTFVSDGAAYYDIYVLSGDALEPRDWLCGYYRRPEGYIIVEIFRIAERVRAFIATEEAAKDENRPEGADDSDQAANDEAGD